LPPEGYLTRPQKPLTCGIIPTVFDLHGRVALVTGAGQNVGQAIARALADHGARVAVNDVVADRADAVAGLIRESGGDAVARVFDVTDLTEVLRAVDGFGPVDILVNNAGNGGAAAMSVGQFVDLEPAAWEGPIRVNLYGVLHCCHAVVKGMCERGWGRVVTISSGAGTAGVNIGVTPYSAGKGGGLAFTRSLALEVAPHGVTANSVAIGLMESVRDADVTARLARTIPVRRLGRPEDVAAACVWLASEEAAWVTGQTVQVNGGSVTT
jgi:NAD(P)-dependent dehydrogenase (short-subunit alcohol dehydrogenase family)